MSLQKVLVVDDERINRAALTAVLQGQCEVLLAKNGEQMFARLEQDHDIDLILLDVVMPGMDGFEILRRLKNDQRLMEIPVIFITALSLVEDEERGLALGACDYIIKPFSPAIVRARVGNQLRFVRQRKLLETLAHRDGLTEIPNRRAFDQALAQEAARSERSGQPLSLIFIDIDCFKQYNDHYGHAAGDTVLKTIAQVLGRQLRRPGDLVARYGGEEFVVILPAVDARGGLEVAENLRQTVCGLGLEHLASSVGPVLSISLGGVTSLGNRVPLPRLLEEADRKLYAAKRQGRNQVCWADLTTQWEYPVRAGEAV